MNGQWIGTYSGTNSGILVVDLDEIGDGYAGIVFAYDNNVGLPRTSAYVELPRGQNSVSLRAKMVSIERGTGALVTEEIVAQRFPGVQIPAYADSEWKIGPDEMSVKWETNIGTSGAGQIVRSKGHNPSILISLTDVKSWDDFKKFVLTLEPYRFAFRGHENSTWRLRTSFHRTGRASLIKFAEQDVPALHRHLSGLTTHRFDLSNPFDYAAHLSLAQHHGYPTPILDWTQSPFVAAYFAFKDLRRNKMATE